MALTEEGERFFFSILIGHCFKDLWSLARHLPKRMGFFFYFNRTLFQDFMVLKQCPSESALFQGIVNCDEINNNTLSIKNSIVRVRFIFLEEFLG